MIKFAGGYVARVCCVALLFTCAMIRGRADAGPENLGTGEPGGAEAHVSTETDPAKARTRLYEAHGDQERPPGVEGAPAARPLAPDGRVGDPSRSYVVQDRPCSASNGC